MGRPLNKKYMGNRNVGVAAPNDNMIGGEGLAAYTLGTLGAVVIGDSPTTNRNFPALNIPAPTIANGTQATATVVWEIASISLSSGGTGYANNLSGQAIDQLVGSIYTSATSQPTITVNSNGSGVITAVTLGANRGTWTTIDGTGITTWGIKIGAVTSAQATVTFRVKSITTVNKGSGYATPPTLSWGTNSGTLPAVPTVALTTDSGNVGSSTNAENAILAWAYTGGSLVEVDLQKQVSAKRYRFNKTGEIAKQGAEIGRIRYDGVAGSSNANPYTAAEGVELNIVAVDASGGTYLVRKLYNRTCTVKSIGIPSSGSNPAALFGVTANQAGSVYTDGKQYKWTFGTPDATTIKILNA